MLGVLTLIFMSRVAAIITITGSQCPTVADSVIGLINLLYEVIMTHIKEAAYGLFYSGWKFSLTEAQTPTKFLEQIFFRFFSLHNIWRKKKEKYHSIVKELLPPKAGFIVPSPVKLKYLDCNLAFVCFEPIQSSAVGISRIKTLIYKFQMYWIYTPFLYN